MLSDEFWNNQEVYADLSALYVVECDVFSARLSTRMNRVIKKALR